jgi:hypothetical protein
MRRVGLSILILFSVSIAEYKHTGFFLSLEGGPAGSYESLYHELYNGKVFLLGGSGAIKIGSAIMPNLIIYSGISYGYRSDEDALITEFVSSPDNSVIPVKRRNRIREHNASIPLGVRYYIPKNNFYVTLQQAFSLIVLENAKPVWYGSPPSSGADPADYWAMLETTGTLNSFALEIGKEWPISKRLSFGINLSDQLILCLNKKLSYYDDIINSLGVNIGLTINSVSR